MKRTMEYREALVLHNSPVLDAESISVPDFKDSSTNTATLSGLIENSPRLKIAEVLVINVKV